MTAPQYQGRGLAGFLICKSLFALKLAGYSELYLVVTEGNTPAEKLYRKIGFEFIGPAN
jgi:ribosomal protein S18 acetylase RimI-like enzyme